MTTSLCVDYWVYEFKATLSRFNQRRSLSSSFKHHIFSGTHELWDLFNSLYLSDWWLHINVIISVISVIKSMWRPTVSKSNFALILLEWLKHTKVRWDKLNWGVCTWAFEVLKHRDSSHCIVVLMQKYAEKVTGITSHTAGKPAINKVFWFYCIWFL